MLYEFWQNVTHNLFKPLLLFFYLGFLIPILKVRFEFPYVIYQGLTMYLLLAIGWRGGEQLAAINSSDIDNIAGFVLLGFVLNFVIGEQLSRRVDGSRTDPAVIGVYVDIIAAHDGEYVSAGEALTVFEDRRDTERGRWFGDEAGAVEEHPHTGDNRCLLDQDSVVSDQEEVVQNFRDGMPSGDAVSDGVGRVGGDDAPLAP